MKLKHLFVIVFLISLSSITYSQTVEELTKERAVADTLLRNKDYAGALKIYETLIRKADSLNIDDNKFIGILYQFASAAVFNYFVNSGTETQYSKVLEYSNKAIIYYQRAGLMDYAFTIINQIVEIYNLLDLLNEPMGRTFSQDDETVEIHVGVLEILKKEGQNWIIKIDAGSFDGIFAGGKGDALGTYSKEFPDRGNLNLGTAEVITVDNFTSTVKISMRDTVSVEMRLQENDMIKLPARMKEYAEKGIVFELAKLQIRFLTNEGKALFHPRHVLQSDSPELEDVILELMKQDVRQTLEIIEPLIPDNPSWSQPMEGGRFKGMSMLEAMEKVNKADVRAFLMFVMTFPGKYMGHTWKINETYATWLINNTPIGEQEMFEMLMSASSDQERNTIFDKYKNDYYDGEFNVYWSIRSQEAAAENKIAYAYEIYEKTILPAANYYNDTSHLGWAYFNLGKIKDAENDRPGSIEAYEKSMGFFVASDDIKGESFSINNIANHYTKMEKYEDALEYFKKSYNLKLIVLKTDSSAVAYENAAISQNGIANCYFNLSRYNEAIEGYLNSISLFTKANSVTGFKGIRELYGSIGDCYEKMSNYSDAINYYEKKLESNRNLGDQLGEAEAMDQIAYIYSKWDKTADANKMYYKAYENKLALGDIDGAGFSLSNVAQTYWTMGEYDNAIKTHLDAIKLREKAGNFKGIAYSWKKLGSLYKESGDPNNAINAYEKAADFYSKTGEKKESATIYEEQGDNFYNVKDYQKAIAQYEKALNIFTEIKSRNDVARLTSSLGSCYYAEKNFARAKEHYTVALEIQKEINDLYGQMNNHLNLGSIAEYYEADYQQAEAQYFKALEFADSIGSKSNNASCMLYIARFYDSRIKYDKAEDYYFKALNIYKTVHEVSSEVNAMINIGFFLTRRGEFEDAGKYFDKAIVIADSISNRKYYASAASGKSQLKRILGQFQEALDLEIKSLEISRETDNLWGVAGSYIGLGNTYNAMGEYEKAINYYMLSDSLYSILSIESSRSTAINNIGTIYYWQGDYDSALEKFNLALELSKKPGGDAELQNTIIINIGEIYSEKKEYAEAEKWLKEGLKAAEDAGNKYRKSSALAVMGKVASGKGDQKTAVNYYLESYNILKELKGKESLIDLAYYLGESYYAMDDLEKAKNYLDEAISLSDEIGGNKFLWKSKYISALISRKDGNVKESIDQLKDAIAVIEQIKSKVVGGESAQKLFASNESVTNVYSEIVSQLLKLDRKEEAFEYLERGNNEELKNKLGKMNINFDNPEDILAVETSKEKKRTVDQIDQQIIEEKSKPVEFQNKDLLTKLEERKQVAEKDYIMFVNTTIKDKPYLKNHISASVNPIDFMRQKRFIPQDMAIILYLLADDDLYVFCATSDSVFANSISITRNEIDNKVKDYYALLTNPSFSIATRGAAANSMDDSEQRSVDDDKDKFISLSEELYEILISPISKVIEGKEKVAIIPNGNLYYLPFHALGRQNTDGTFHFFAADHEIFYGHQLTYLINKMKAIQNYKLLALGNADSSLPYAEEEVEDLKEVFPQSLVYIKSDATKERVLNSPNDYNVLHLATHGILDYNSFENSYLLLAPDNASGDDGKLKISDVWSIPSMYNYNMVTLSACETAVSFELSEGWPITTASAFLDVGVPSVIASLWSVDDAATSTLMKTFYEKLKTMPKVKALQEAQIELAHNPKYSHPYFWAPFMLVGSWQ